ncbi:MAG: site-specific DNA-methyltransferase, partial [Hyphomicrobiaceae bacterium]|nr:site-specific DNA-methyltransferase [Hyphomicrobiaceae bacterium]
NQKPVECMRRPVLNNSNPGQLVYDPFAGTGTTLVACQLTGRMARCIEIDPKFCQMIVDRYRTLFVDDLAATGKDDGA